MRTTRRVGVLVTGIFLLGVVPTASAERAELGDPARLAFGLDPFPAGTVVENEWGMDLTAREVTRLERASALIDRGKVLAGQLDSLPKEFGGAWFDRATDTLVVQLVDPSAETLASVSTFSLGGPVEIRRVKYTMAELAAAQLEVEAAPWARRCGDYRH
jgi:hypothetical protein